MNRVSLARRVAVLGMLMEGFSLHATSLLAAISINTVTKLLLDLGHACAAYHDEHIRNIRVHRLECDEIWTFVGTKAKNPSQERKLGGWGDTWTWTALDADTKLCVSYLVGGRDGGWAKEFIHDCASRILGPVRITMDGRRTYLNAVEDGFGMEVDCAQLNKIYGATEENGTRCSLPQRIGYATKVSGNPDSEQLSTSLMEYRNLTTRMGIRRFTRLSNAFSKKVENHTALVAIHFMYYNFARKHETLMVTPTMAAGLADHVWTLEEIALLSN